MNREAWLMKATEKMRPWFKYAEAELPERVRVSTGYSKRAGKAIGWCWVQACDGENVNQVFISPELEDSVEVLATLLHELVHAADNCESNHGANFKRIATDLGLTGKMTATHPDETLTLLLKEIVDKLGEYPHAALNPGAKPGGPKQGTRMILTECESTGYKARTTRKWLDEYGAPSCPCCQEVMEVRA